jgi:hypothetical protein
VKRIFAVIVLLDVTLLIVPTRWMGTHLEFGLASVLALATALVWLALRFNAQDT